MMIENNSTAFGSKVQRFGKITVHPNLDPSGLYTRRPQGCDPCLYSPKSIKEAFQVNKNRVNDKDPWRYKNDLEDWSKNLGYRNEKVLDNKRWFNSVLGPAWYDISNIPAYQPACKNVGFGRTARFKASRTYTPGPGTYYKPTEFKSLKKQFSKRQTFDREDPCRFKDNVPKWSLAPNRYTVSDKNSIENKSNKIVSLRGPYDLFTGNRDGSTIKNHFNESLKCGAATWPIALKGCLETYKNSHFGEMNKSNRNVPYRGRNAIAYLPMCLRQPSEPGPEHYNVDLPKVFKQNKQGFNSSYDKPPGYKRVVVWPGVGRYRNVETIRHCIRGQGHRHVFLSKQQRTIGAILPTPMNSF